MMEMEKEKNLSSYRLDKEEQDVLWLDSAVLELKMRYDLGEEELEAVRHLLELAEEQAYIHITDIYGFVPESEEDRFLLVDIVDLFHSAEIKVIEDDERLQLGESKHHDEGDTSSDIDDEIGAIQEEIQVEAADAGDTVGLYLSQVGSVPLLDREEEVELAKRIERGREASRELAEGRFSGKERSALLHLIEDGQAAREHLLLANVRLVFSVAKKYAGRGIPILDLVQEGHIGLMRATKKFEYQRGYKFSTYATWWIRQAISRYVADKGRTIRLPVHMGDKINKLLRTRHRLIQEVGRDPTPEELAVEVEESPLDIRDMLKYAKRAISLETPIGAESDSTLSDFIEDEGAPDPMEEATEQLLSEHLHDVLAQLPSREARVLRLRFGLSGGHAHTLKEIGDKMGITRERVRQIELKARNRIRKFGLQNELREYLLE